MNNRRSSDDIASGTVAWPWAGIGLALAFLAAHTVYVVTIGADVAYMDSLRYIGYYFERPWDGVAWARFWNQGDHHGLISQLVLWLNIRVLGMNVLVVNVLTGFVLLGTALVLFASYLRFARIRGQSPGAARALLVLAAMLSIVFSLAGFELYTLDLGFPENLRNGMFLALGCWLLQRERRLGVVGCSLLSLALLALMLLCAYGRIYSFAGALMVAAMLASVRGEWNAGRAALICTVVTVVLGLAAYMVLGAVLPKGIGSTGLQHVSPVAAVRAILFGASSSFLGMETIDHFAIPLVAVGCVGALLLGLLAWRCVSYLVAVRGCGSVVPVFLIAYGSITLLAVAFSRGSEPLGAMASRYYPDVCWLLLGLVWILATHADIGRRSRWLTYLLLLPVLIGYCLSQVTETVIWPYRAEAFATMRRATLTCDGVPDSSVALLQANNHEILQHAIDLQRHYRLGVWRHAVTPCSN